VLVSATRSVVKQAEASTIADVLGAFGHIEMRHYIKKAQAKPASIKVTVTHAIKIFPQPMTTRIVG
jgi:hypothetical protein